MGKPFTVNINRYDPYKAYRFLVYFGTSTSPVCAVSKVGAIKRSSDPIEYKSGGDPITRIGLGRTKYDPITLERGLTKTRTSPPGPTTRRCSTRARPAPRWPICARRSASICSTKKASLCGDSSCTAAGSRSTRRCLISTPAPTPSPSSTSSSRTKAGSRTLPSPNRRSFN